MQGGVGGHYYYQHNERTCLRTANPYPATSSDPTTILCGCSATGLAQYWAWRSDVSVVPSLGFTSQPEIVSRQEPGGVSSR